MGRKSIVPDLEKKLNTPLKPWLVSRINEGKTPEQIAAILEIGKSKAYELIKGYGLKDTLKSVKRGLKTGSGELQERLDEYYAEKKRARHSEYAISKGISFWKNFSWWLANKGIPLNLDAVSRYEVVTGFIDYIMTEKNRFGKQFRDVAGEETVRTYKKYLLAFINWCQGKEYLPEGKAGNPFQRMTIKEKKSKRAPEDMPDEIIEKVLDSFGDERFEDVRNKAIISWFLETGMRRGGVVSLKVQQFDWDTGRGRVIEKGDKQRTIVLSKVLKAQMKRYLDAREALAKTDYLWISSKGEALEIGAIYDLVAACNEIPGVKEEIAKLPEKQRFHPHLFRHVWAKHLARTKIPLFSIMKMGGWEDLKLVQHYAAAYSADEAWEYIDEASPLSNIRRENAKD